MRIALAQLNPTIGDFAGNRDKILGALAEARTRGAGLCVFPEMAITGYPPHDLLERDRFVSQGLEVLDQIARSTGDGEVAAVLGFVRRNPASVGKPLQNAAALLAGGAIVSEHPKALLPTYDVFDERRYFAPASDVTPTEHADRRLGISVCEDIWNTAGSIAAGRYDRDPIAELVDQGAEILINVSASPFTLDKRTARQQLLADAARRHGRPVVFVNQVGGNDDLVFDGRSAAYDADGTLLARAGEFAEDLVVVDLDDGSGEIRNATRSDEEATLEALCLGTRDYVTKCGFGSVVLGLSGGIDSAMVAAIAARALRPDNVHAVAMPSRYSSQASRDDAEQLARNLGIHFHVHSIDDLFQGFLDELAPAFTGLAPDVTEENIQARLRAVLLMSLSNKLGHLLLTTGNKSEAATGYCTLYGDMAGGLAVLADVPKTLVYRLAQHLNRHRETIPQSIIDKPPSAELRADQKDEDSLPPYTVLDEIIRLHVDEGADRDAIIAAGIDEQIVRDVLGLIQRSEYKRRQAPPGLKITSKAFGFGRRIPMAQRWRG
ncbi:MAG: NAD+ synthase [Deltaproteobacteria bacterium]|nr:NAD+ synthase [Deltaproteobacteria bacterium]